MMKRIMRQQFYGDSVFKNTQFYITENLWKEFIFTKSCNFVRV